MPFSLSLNMTTKLSIKTFDINNIYRQKILGLTFS